MKHLDGEKISGSHTTVIELAYEVLSVIINYPSIKSVSLGIIKNQVGSSQRTVKIIDLESGGLMLVFKQTSSIQETTLYVHNGSLQQVKEYIARYVRDNKISLQFGRR